MESAVIAAIASIISALIALLGVILSQKKADAARRSSEELSLRLKQIEANYQSSLASLHTDLDRMTYIINSNHAKRIDVLSEAYSMAADVKITLEQYVVPIFIDSKTKDINTLCDASRKFEELYKYCSQKAIFFNEDSNIITSIGELMGCIKRMRNMAEESQETVKPEQAMIVIGSVGPVLSAIRKEIREDLKLNYQ